jgi:hypothetical protein|tara:strand:+ start:68 stop:319 length:252 start_codon:yes stop_codon:yes gene_type:complete
MAYSFATETYKLNGETVVDVHTDVFGIMFRFNAVYNGYQSDAANLLYSNLRIQEIFDDPSTDPKGAMRKLYTDAKAIAQKELR